MSRRTVWVLLLVQAVLPAAESTGRLANLSVRAAVSSTTEGALTAGFVVAGPGSKSVLVRAAGPALTAFGVADALGDPQLELFRHETSVAYNDDWNANTNPAQLAAVSGAIGAFAFHAGTKDAALLLPAASGAYTAAVTAASGEPGAALIEVYDSAAVRTEIPPRTFDLVGFGRVAGHGIDTVTGGGSPGQPFDPGSGNGNFWRIDESVAAAADFPAQFRAAVASDRPLVIELDAMLDLSRVALPSNGATAIAHPDLFAPGRTTGTIGLLIVGSNKTIYSAFGAGGFRRGTLRIDGKHNVIQRNLKFRELWEWDDATSGQYDRNDWDYITILSQFSGAGVTARAHHIWVDHCDFEKSYDGLLDTVQGANLITVSWCKFAGVMSGESARWVRRQMDYVEANPDLFPSHRLYSSFAGSAALREREKFQFKANLIGNSTEPQTAARDRGHLNVTLHHNWYFNVDQRMPRMRFGNAHVFNLLADSSAGRSLLALGLEGVVATSGAVVRVDNAWFTGLQTPVSIQVGVEPVGTVQVRNSINQDPATGVGQRYETLRAAPGAVFAWNPPDPQSGINGWPADDPEAMPAGYNPAGTTLSAYLDSPADLGSRLAWVGVITPADAAEAQLWRARWQSIGP